MIVSYQEKCIDLNSEQTFARQLSAASILFQGCKVEVEGQRRRKVGRPIAEKIFVLNGNKAEHNRKCFWIETEFYER